MQKTINQGRDLWNVVGVVALVLAVILCARAYRPRSSGWVEPTPTLNPDPTLRPNISVCPNGTGPYMDLDGVYSVAGGPLTPDAPGERYTGTVTIYRVQENCFNIRWDLDNGQTRIGSFGMGGNILTGRWQSGDQSGLFEGTAGDDGAVSFAWGPGEIREYALVYRDRLTLISSSSVAEPVNLPVCSDPAENFVEVEGSYSVAGRPASAAIQGSPYSGDVAITRVARNCFNIKWALDDGRTRIGSFRMVGAAIIGRWKSGDETGRFEGAARDSDGRIDLGWGPGEDDAHLGDFQETLTLTRSTRPLPGPTPPICVNPLSDFIDLHGTYSVKGGPTKTNLEVAPYTGTATITVIGKNCFQIEWQLDNGQTRSGTYYVARNSIFGRWWSGKQSGRFLGGSSPVDGSIHIHWGVGDTDKHLDDYEEEMVIK